MSKHSLVEIAYGNAFWYICDHCGFNCIPENQEELRTTLDSTDCDEHAKMSQTHNWETSQGSMHYKVLFICKICAYESEQDTEVSVPFVHRACKKA